MDVGYLLAGWSIFFEANSIADMVVSNWQKPDASNKTHKIHLAKNVIITTDY